MARHAEILDAFKEILDKFDYSNEEHVTQVRQYSLFSDVKGGDRNNSLSQTMPVWRHQCGGVTGHVMSRSRS